MDHLEFIYDLFNGQPYKKVCYYPNNCVSEDEFCIGTDRYIESSDLILKEIEFLVNGNSDLNYDKHKIKNLLKLFEEIEYNLVEASVTIRMTVNGLKYELSKVNLETDDCSQQNTKQIFLSEKEKSIKTLSVISEILDRKRKVDLKLKELSIKSCFK
jgi:hypothetical protein